MMSLKVVDAESGSAHRDFIGLPWAINRDDPYWVPPLRREVAKLLSLKHPFFQHAERKLFLVRDGEQPVGRIAAIINHNHNRFHDEKAGFFGFFEAFPDPGISSVLFAAAEGWLRGKGAEFVMGPMNPSTNEECGLLVDNFMSSPLVMMTYNPPYYMDLIEDAGYSKAKDLYAYSFNTPRTIPPRLEKLTKRIEKREKDLVTRPVDMKRFAREIEVVKAIYNDAWEKNWGFVPMTDAEMDQMAKDLKPIIVPELTIFAFIGDEPAGFIMSLPDYNQVLKVLNGRMTPWGILRAIRAAKRIRTGRCITLGVREKFRKRGLEAPLFAATLRAGIEKGYRYGEFSWILEDNTLVNETINKVFSATHYKTYRIYRKDL